METYFVDVVLPLPLPKLYTYRVPRDMNRELAIGKRVIVQFGKSKLYSALIKSIHIQAPQHYEAKYIISVLDDNPIVDYEQWKLWDWISEYYMCSLGEVMMAAIPSALKLESEARIKLNQDVTVDKENLIEKEYLIVEALELHPSLKIKDIIAITGNKNVHKFINSLVEKGIVEVQENIIAKTERKVSIFIKLSEEYKNNEEKIQNLFNTLEKKAPKQLEVLMSFYKLSFENKEEEVSKSKIVEGGKNLSAAVDALEKKGVFLVTAREEQYENLVPEKKDLILSPLQQVALNNIIAIFEKKEVTLLHGVTSSGKTEIFVKCIEEILNQGKCVLYLLPEIALTTQLTNRLKFFFGESLAVFHSRLNETERIRVWNRLRSPDNTIKVIIGARSSVFLPLQNLGLIIVDEEHETSFKQFDPAPRYNARDTAIYLASIHKAKTLLASATPSVESFYNASNEKYGLVSISERYGNVDMPQLKAVDIKEEIKKKKMKSHFSSVLFDSIQAALESKEQVILFQNRRGFAPLLECADCAWVPHCIHCDVSLTFHKYSNKLKCHYCGYSQALISICNACGNSNMQLKGFGTEKVAEELGILFPKATVMRLDADSTRLKNAYLNILNDFEERKIDILVGTQMISKGLNFSNVNLVGVLNADALIHFPDFRATERSFQMITQVSGRAGRKNKQGIVYIQTYNPSSKIIQQIINHDYIGMYNDEIKEREQFKYPPFYRLIQISIKNKNLDLLNSGSLVIANKLKEYLGKRVLGPEAPLISRIKNYHIKELLIKIERNSPLNDAKKNILAIIRDFQSKKEHSSFLIQIDVDPL